MSTAFYLDKADANVYNKIQNYRLKGSLYMKRFAALLTAFVLLLSASALAFKGEGYPAWDGVKTPDNGLCAMFDGESISLSLDPSSDYSNLADGVLQVCFFAYDAADDYFLEMYLLIPQDAASGDVLTDGMGLDCSIYLYETNASSEVFYYAGDLDNSTASDSSFEMTIESAESSASAISMRGQLRAQMVRYDREATGLEILTIDGAQFNFTLPLTESSYAPASTEEPKAYDPNPSNPGTPEATDPALPDASHPNGSAPAFTLPPDYISI